ncbi:MAG: hemolysin III family protein [Sulfitobacter sp.]
MGYFASKAETIADGIVHLAGLVLAIPASFYLLATLDTANNIWTGTALYVATLLFALVASALYHMLPFERGRDMLGRIDHASIYFKIAGSYTPVVVLIGSGFAYGILGLVWALATLGAVAKLWFWRADSKGSLALYLGMGWMSVLLLWPMWNALPGASVMLIMLGGAIYSLGTLIYKKNGMRYQYAIWHSFVLIASASLFTAIALSVQAAPH